MTTRPTLAELQADDDFVHRHIGPTADDVAGDARRPSASADLDELLDQTVPAGDPHGGRRSPLPGPRSVADVLGELRAPRRRRTSGAPA